MFWGGHWILFREDGFDGKSRVSLTAVGGPVSGDEEVVVVLASGAYSISIDGSASRSRMRQVEKKRAAEKL